MFDKVLNTPLKFNSLKFVIHRLDTFYNDFFLCYFVFCLFLLFIYVVLFWSYKKIKQLMNN